MEFDLVLAGGAVVTDRRVSDVNIGVREGRIAAIAREPLRGREILDCAGLTVLPGGIDTHVHFREPGRTDKEDFGSGSAAAAVGGITSVLEIQNNEPFTVDVPSAAHKLGLITPKAHVNFGIYGSVGVQNLDRLKDLAPHVVAFKAFMAQSVGPLTVTDLGELYRAFMAIRETGRVLALHAESDAVIRVARQGLPDHVSAHAAARPPVAEWLAVGEAIELCRCVGTPINLPHLSTGRAVDLVERAKQDGLPVSAATCAHYLQFSADDVATGGNEWKVNPSIKHPADRARLLEGVRTGIIDHVHSDHAPHTVGEKAKAYSAASSGIPGIQQELPSLLDLAAQGVLSLPDVARLLGEGPALAFGLRDRGVIRVGAHADFAVVDPGREVEIRQEEQLSRAAPSPYLGRRLRGAVVMTLLAGRVIARAGRLLDPGRPAGAPLSSQF